MTRRELLQRLGAGLAALTLGCRSESTAPRRLKHWAWMGAGVGSDDDARRTFARLKASGIDALLLQRKPRRRAATSV